MIKHSNYKDDYNFFYKRISIADYNLQSFNVYKQWKSITPIDMNSNKNDSFSVQVNRDGSQIYKAFNHSEDWYSDLGLIYKNNPSIVNFSFSKKWCIIGLKFTLKDINYAFNISFQASIDNNIWNKINEFVIGEKNISANQASEWDSTIHYFNSNGTGTLKNNPTIFCKFTNNKKYQFYRLVFTPVYDLDNVGLKVCKMSLYDQLSELSPIFNIGFTNSGVLSPIINNETNITEENIAQFKDNSYIKYSQFLFNRLDKKTITFNAKFDKNISGEIMYKHSDFQLKYDKNQDYLEFELIDHKLSFMKNKFICNIENIDNEWHHYALIFNKNESIENSSSSSQERFFQLYVDGKLFNFSAKNNNGLINQYPNLSQGFYLGNYDLSNSSSSINNTEIFYQLKDLFVYDYVLSENIVRKDKGKHD